MSHLLTVGFRQETHKKTAGVKRDHNRLGGSSPYIEAILKHIAMPFRGGDYKESSVLQYGAVYQKNVPASLDTLTQRMRSSLTATGGTLQTESALAMRERSRLWSGWRVYDGCV
jgi:hypothetical protein